MLIHVFTTTFSWRELPPFFTMNDESPASLVEVLMPLLDHSPLIAMIESVPSLLGLLLVLAVAAFTLHHIWAIPSVRGLVPFACFALLCLPLPPLIAVVVIIGWMLAVWLPYDAVPVVESSATDVLWRAPSVPVEH